jgi:hypothetical protein
MIEEMSSDGLHRLNERQAWQLLDIDRLFAQASREAAPLSWERAATGLVCYHTVAGTGLFGMPPLDHPRALGSLLKDKTTWDFGYLLMHRGDDLNAPFVQSAVFLDLVSEWIRCDDIYTVLSAPEFPLLTRLAQENESKQDFGHKDQAAVVKLVEKTTGLPGFARGLYKYAELAEDLNDFCNREEFPSARRWFQQCMSFWFQDSMCERVRILLLLFEPPWYSKTGSVRELRRLSNQRLA